MNLPAKKKYESARQLERQAKILAKTREMLAEIGYARTTIRSLADKAGVAPGTLYNLYNSKDELILAAVQELLSSLGETVREQSTRGLDRLITKQAVNGATVRENPEYAEAMTRALIGTQRNDKLRNLLYTSTIEHDERHLQIAIEQGHLRPGTDVQLLARHLQAQSWGITVAWVMDTVALDNIAEETIRSVTLTLLAVATAEGEACLRELAERFGLPEWPLC